MTGFHIRGPGVARVVQLDDDGQPTGKSTTLRWDDPPRAEPQPERPDPHPYELLRRNVVIEPGERGPGVYAPLGRPWWADEVVDLMTARGFMAEFVGVSGRTAAVLQHGDVAGAYWDLQVTWLRARRRAGGRRVPGLPRGVFPVALAALRRLLPRDADMTVFMVPDDEVRGQG